MSDKIAEIKAQHLLDESWRADGYDPVVGRLPQSHDHRGFLLAEVERLRAERDTLLLDAREFAAWFQYHFSHVYVPAISPLKKINDWMNAYADTLAALDAAMEKIDKEGER